MYYDLSHFRYIDLKMLPCITIVQIVSHKTEALISDKFTNKTDFLVFYFSEGHVCTYCEEGRFYIYI